MDQKKISKITQNQWRDGFLGKGHRALAVIDGLNYRDTDPFVVFMDDNIQLPGDEPAGGPHPHAGLETLTLVIEGNTQDWKEGSFEIMTAGKGIIHTEEITSEQKLRILQVWLALPPEKRKTNPYWQKITADAVPKIKTDNSEIRVYSGSSNGLTSPISNHTPLNLIEFRLNKNVAVQQDIPKNHNGIIYVITGSIKAGDKIINKEQAGILEKSIAPGAEMIQFEALENNTRFVLYTAPPHNVASVHYGPFVSGSMEDISQLYKDFRNGEFPHLKNLPETQIKIYE